MKREELDRNVRELRELSRMADELAAEIAAIQDEIKRHMDAQRVDTLTGADWAVSWKPVASHRIDTGALKKAMPDIAAAFTKETVTRRFVVA